MTRSGSRPPKTAMTREGDYLNTGFRQKLLPVLIPSVEETGGSSSWDRLNLDHMEAYWVAMTSAGSESNGAPGEQGAMPG